MTGYDIGTAKLQIRTPEQRFSLHLASFENGCDGLMESLLRTAFEWLHCFRVSRSRCESSDRHYRLRWSNEFSQTAGGVLELLRECGQQFTGHQKMERIINTYEIIWILKSKKNWTNYININYRIPFRFLGTKPKYITNRIWNNNI